MFGKQKTDIDDTYLRIADRIKEELVSTFEKKGINFSRIQIDMNSGNVNVEVCINEE